MDAIGPFFGCVGFLAILAALVMGIVALAKMASLQDEVAKLNSRLTRTENELFASRRATTAAPATAPAPTLSISPREAARDRIVHGLSPSAPESIPPATPPASTPAPSIPAPIPPAAESNEATFISPQQTPPPVPTPPPAPAIPPTKPLTQPAKTSPGLEAYLGTRLFVVIGAIALALAGILLVKYAVDRNYFSPAVRVIAGAAAGFALIGVAQWRRKQEPFIAQGLSAAGIVALFAAIFAATSLYHFLLPIWGFAFLAGVTALAVGLSLQKQGGGPLMATLGLIGGFVTPLLVNSNSPHVPGLFGYLLLLHVGMVTVTRKRGWSILAGLSVVAASGWLLFWLAFMPWNPADGPILGLFMLATGISTVVATLNNAEAWRGTLAARALTWISSGLALLAACVLLGKSDFSDLQWGFFAALALGTFVLGRMRSHYEGLAWACAIAVLAMLVTWGTSQHVIWNFSPETSPDAAHVYHQLQCWLIAFGIGSVIAAYVCIWGSAVPMRWGLLATLLAVAYVAAAYGVLGHSPRPDAWAYVPLAAAALMIALAVPIYRRRATMRTGEETLAIFAHGILALLLIAPPMALKDGALTAAWCALLPLVALAIWRCRLTDLMYGFFATLLLATIRGIFFLARLEGEGPSLWWNPIIWNYGSLLLAAIASMLILERATRKLNQLEQGDGIVPSMAEVSALLQTVAVAAGFFMFSLLVHWHFSGGHLRNPPALFTERSTYTVGWLALAAVLLWLGRSLRRPALLRCGEVVAAIGMLYVLLAMVLFTNPLWWGDAVGSTLVFNSLLYAYGLPALLCAALAWLISRSGGNAAVAKAAAITALILLAVLTSLEVRQGFHGEYLNQFSMTFVERGTYAIAWLILAAILLVIGYRFHLNTVRIAGLTLSTIAIGFVVIVCGFAANPLWLHEPVGGTRIANWLLYVFGLPMLATGAFTILLWNRGKTERTHAQLLGIAGLFLAFILVSLEVRQFFQGPFLDIPGKSTAEMASYSAAWATLGGIFLTAGILRKSALLRWASLLLMLLTIFKVFIFDMSDLKDLLRVLSFAGLGLSLMALAFVYQHFVFRKPTEPTT